MGKLTLQKDGSLVRQIGIQNDLTTIGRSEKCDMPVDNPGVSRVHCQIQYKESNKTYILHDNGSSNGTFINGIKIPGQQLLKNGDSINLGKYSVIFETEAHDEQVPPKPGISVTVTAEETPVQIPPRADHDITGTATARDSSLSLMPMGSPDEALVADAIKWAGIGAALVFAGTAVWVFF